MGISKLPKKIMLFGDSEYTVSAMETELELNIWFGNKVAEVRKHMARWKSLGIEVDRLYHWPGASNLTDIATKERGVVQDMQADGVWQKGPSEARYPRDTWLQGLPQEST